MKKSNELKELKNELIKKANERRFVNFIKKSILTGTMGLLIATYSHASAEVTTQNVSDIDPDYSTTFMNSENPFNTAIKVSGKYDGEELIISDIEKVVSEKTVEETVQTDQTGIMVATLSFAGLAVISPVIGFCAMVNGETKGKVKKHKNNIK